MSLKLTISKGNNQILNELTAPVSTCDWADFRKALQKFKVETNSLLTELVLKDKNTDTTETIEIDDDDDDESEDEMSPPTTAKKPKL